MTVKTSISLTDDQQAFARALRRRRYWRAKLFKADQKDAVG
jgi:hypothetical protein